MCNKLHSDSTPIPKEGEGWKYFVKNKNGRLLQWYNEKPYEGNNEAIEWNEKNWNQKNNFESGFCFLMSKINLFEELDAGSGKVVLRKINYWHGIGRHFETNFILEGIEIALCKKFTVELEKGEYL